MRKLFLALTALVLLVDPALAQKPRPTAPAAPPTAALPQVDPQAAARLIEEHRMGDLFEPVADEYFVAIRHRESGFVCRFEPGEPAQLVVFPGLPRGDDVGCNQVRSTGEIYTLYATRYPAIERFSAEDQARGALEIMRERYPNPTPWTPPFEMRMEGAALTLPETFSARLIFVDRDRQRYMTRVSVAQVGDWSLKMRFTSAPLDEGGPEAAEIHASVFWDLTLVTFVEGNPSLAI